MIDSFSKVSKNAADLAAAVKPQDHTVEMYQSRTLIEYHLKQAARISREVAERLTRKAEKGNVG